MIFWDSSALVKAYAADERDHGKARSLLTGRGPHAGSLLLAAEATSAVVRWAGLRRPREQILPLLKQHLERFHLVPMDADQAAAAVAVILRHRLRGADGVHLAAALTLARAAGRRELRVATADAELARAARAERLRVIELAL